MVPCDPSIQVPFPDGHILPWWANRERAKAEFAKVSAKDADTFIRIDDQLKEVGALSSAVFPGTSARDRYWQPRRMV